MDFQEIMQILGLFLGGGGIASFLTLRYTRMRERGEARSAENEATKSVQDVYQELVSDVKADREGLKNYIVELKEDRHHLREERNELRRRLDDTDDKVRWQEKQIARLGNRIDALTPLICTMTSCKKRVRNYIGLVSDESFSIETDKPEEKNEEEQQS